MSKKENQDTTSKVVSLPKAKQLQESQRKWGVVTMKCNFSVVPALLFRAQGRLGISPTQLAIILQIHDFWWHADRWPWVSKGELSQRLNISEKIIQRNLKELDDRGYVKRITRVLNHRRRANGYDLSGLITRLQELAPEFIAAAEAKKKVEKKGGGIDLLERIVG